MSWNEFDADPVLEHLAKKRAVIVKVIALIFIIICAWGAIIANSIMGFQVRVRTSLSGLTALDNENYYINGSIWIGNDQLPFQSWTLKSLGLNAYNESGDILMSNNVNLIYLEGDTLRTYVFQIIFSKQTLLLANLLHNDTYVTYLAFPHIELYGLTFTIQLEIRGALRYEETP